MLRSPGLYVHLPWCIKKCPYCDFNSHAVRDTPPFADYTEAVIADLEHQIRTYAPDPFGSVFFGGGTPSLFAPEHIGRILTAASKAGIEDGAEITLEANPGAIEHGSFRAYRQVGVNRISLGVQSFAPARLTALGRVHSDHEARQAIVAIHKAGISELNIDLMYGLPDQSVEEALGDVLEALSYEPTHVSHYQLTLEPNTLFAAKPPTLPDDDACFAMQQSCQNALAEAGLGQYEVSAYARENFEGNHNLNYWRFGDYLGVGAGAHGKVTEGEVLVRTVKAKHPAQYLQDPLAVTLTHPGTEDQLFEFMLNRLRLNQPISWREQQAHSVFATPEMSHKIRRAHTLGLMETTDDGDWSKTALGYRFLNDLQEIFLPN